MKLTEQDLLDKKSEITEAKTKLAELKGSEKTLMTQLKKDWKCSNLSQAKKKITDFKSEADKLDIEIEIATEKLEEKYFNEE